MVGITRSKVIYFWCCFALARRSAFGAAISLVRARTFFLSCNSILFNICRSHCHGCIEVPWCCACAGSSVVFRNRRCKSHWSGCVKVALSLWCFFFLALSFHIYNWAFRLLRVFTKRSPRNCVVSVVPCPFLGALRCATHGAIPWTLWSLWQVVNFYVLQARCKNVALSSG